MIAMNHTVSSTASAATGARVRGSAIRLLRQWATSPGSYTPPPSSRWRAPVIIIDGRSGSGKSTAASALARDIRIAGVRNLQVTGPDLWFPGWGGLAAGSHIVEDILTNAHRAPGFFHWDWAQNRWGSYSLLDPCLPLLIEGCGALTAATARVADLRVWVEADAALRRERALHRDGQTFAPFWRIWAEQEDTHMVTHRPDQLADFIIRTDAEVRI